MKKVFALRLLEGSMRTNNVLALARVECTKQMVTAWVFSYFALDFVLDLVVVDFVLSLVKIPGSCE